MNLNAAKHFGPSCYMTASSRSEYSLYSATIIINITNISSLISMHIHIKTTHHILSSVAASLMRYEWLAPHCYRHGCCYLAWLPTVKYSVIRALGTMTRV
jgi:hypothetical protein